MARDISTEQVVNSLERRFVVGPARHAVDRVRVPVLGSDDGGGQSRSVRPMCWPASNMTQRPGWPHCGVNPNGQCEAA